MLIFGLLLLLAGVLVILVALFTSGGTNGTAELLGNDLTTLTIFFLGVGAGVAVLWGFAIIRWGMARTMQRRRERARLTELSQKLDEVEAERDRKGEDDDSTKR